LRAALRRWAARVPFDAPLRPANAEFGCCASVDACNIGWLAMGTGVVVPWEDGGVEGRRWQDEDGVWRAVSATQGIMHAWRAWVAAGGARAMARERGRLRGVDETRRAARLVELAERQGRRPSNALAALANARRLLHQQPAVRSRMLRNEEVASGVVSDGRGRWAVDQILQWRGSGSGRQALVRWFGFNAVTGEAWDDSWEPWSNLTADLRKGGIIRRRRTAAEMGEDRQREEERYARVQRRRTPRLAGVDPMSGL